MKFDFVAIGDITTDAFIKLSDAEEHIEHGVRELCVRFGDKVPFDEVIEVRAVGNAANAAVSARRLGLTSALITRVGDDTNGRNCIETLKENDIALDFVEIEKGQSTNYHYVLWYGAERTILVKQNFFHYSLPAFQEPPRYLYLTSLGESAKNIHFEIAEYVSKNPDCKLVFQPGTFQMKMGVTVLKDLYAATYLFVCNKEEAQRILQSTESNIRKLSDGILALGPQLVAITDGPNGAYVYDGTTLLMVPQYPDPKPPVSRTGAGDAFTSTLTSYLAKGMSLKDALLRAPINSMWVVQHVGAQTGLLTDDKIEEWLAKKPDSYKVTEVR